MSEYDGRVQFIIADLQRDQSNQLARLFPVRYIPFYVLLDQQGETHIYPPGPSSKAALQEFIEGRVPLEENGIVGLLERGGVLVFVLIFLAGITTGLSPCLVAMAPIMAAYTGSRKQTSTVRALMLSSSMILGLATSLAGLGFLATVAGKVFGGGGGIWTILLGGVFVVVGLNYLKLIVIQWPGMKKLPVQGDDPFSAYLVGLFFGLATSPCATGVLAVLLGFAGSTGSFSYSMLLLFVYGLGHGVPLLVLGTVVGSVKFAELSSKYWELFATVLGLAFVGVGVYLMAGFM